MEYNNKKKGINMIQYVLKSIVISIEFDVKTFQHIQKIEEVDLVHNTKQMEENNTISDDLMTIHIHIVPYLYMSSTYKIINNNGSILWNESVLEWTVIKTFDLVHT